MNISDIPSRIIKAFGLNGLRNTIATNSSTTTDNNGVATFDKGFPPITMQPLSAGGLPPKGQDMNGILYSVTQQQQWQNAGGGFPFNSDFAVSIAGYPKGALIPSSDYSGYWINNVDGNSNNPESASPSNTGWTPTAHNGAVMLSGVTASISLSTLQAAKDQITLSGALTQNINLIFPSWRKKWTVTNNCTGGYVICKTSSGVGTIIYPGITCDVICNGTDVISEFPAKLQTNGEQILPSGLIMKFGTYDLGTATNGTIALDDPFPNATLCAVFTDAVISPSNVADLRLAWNISSTTKSVVGWSSYQGPGAVSLIAIGY